MVYFNKQVDEILRIRESEKARQPEEQHYRKVLHLIQDEYHIDHDTPYPTTTPGKKRKRTPAAPVKESPPALTVLDE